MLCPKCGSDHIQCSTSTYTESKSRSLLWNVLMTICTGGIWIIWMLIRKKKEKAVTKTWATCQDCGYRWEVK